MAREGRGPSALPPFPRQEGKKAAGHSAYPYIPLFGFNSPIFPSLFQGPFCPHSSSATLAPHMNNVATCFP